MKSYFDWIYLHTNYKRMLKKPDSNGLKETTGDSPEDITESETDNTGGSSIQLSLTPLLLLIIFSS